MSRDESRNAVLTRRHPRATVRQVSVYYNDLGLRLSFIINTVEVRSTYLGSGGRFCASKLPSVENKHGRRLRLSTSESADCDERRIFTPSKQ